MAAASVAKIGVKIASKSAGAMKGIVNSTKKFAKSVDKNAKIKKRIRVAEIKMKRKRREDKKRKEKEELLEQQKSQRNAESKKAKGSGAGPLERIMSLIQALLVGFVLNKLPQIVEFIKKVIKVIRDIVDKFKAFFDGVKEFFGGVGKVIGKAFDVISNLKITDIGDKLKEVFGGLKDAFGNIKDKLLEGVKNFLGAKKKKPGEEINGEAKDKDSKDKELKSSVGDIQKTMAGKSEEFNNTIKTIEKAGTGVDIVGPENANLTEQVQSTTTKESDGKETSLKVDGSSGGGSGGGQGNPTNQRGSGQKNRGSGQGNTGSNVSGILGKQASGDKLNISAPKKEIKTTTITPERKSKNTVMIVGNKNNQSSSGGSVKSGGETQIIVKEKNSLKDQFALSLY
jgi:hypothetical protein